MRPPDRKQGKALLFCEKYIKNRAKKVFF